MGIAPVVGFSAKLFDQVGLTRKNGARVRRLRAGADRGYGWRLEAASWHELKHGSLKWSVATQRPTFGFEDR
jgi:hypothetical protein